MNEHQLKAKAEANYPDPGTGVNILAEMKRNAYISGYTDAMKEDGWMKVETPPKLGGEYQVVWNLDDNEYPLVTCMDYDMKSNIWIDPRSTDSPKNDCVLFWKELDPPPVNIPKELWFEKDALKVEPVSMDEFERNIYGQCVHGERSTIK